MKRRLLRDVLSVAWSMACLSVGVVAQRQPAKPISEPGLDMTLYRNGRIYTNDASGPWAEAMLVRGEEILAVGNDDEVSALAEKGTRVVDLEKQFVMPGFNDAHVHLGGAGQDWLAVRLFGAPTVAELQKRLADAVAGHTPGEWITGFGWDHTLWP